MACSDLEAQVIEGHRTECIVGKGNDSTNMGLVSVECMFEDIQTGDRVRS